MKASEVIDRLTWLIKEHGDRDVFLDVSSDGLIEPGEIDMDADDTGIMIWRKEEEADGE